MEEKSREKSPEKRYPMTKCARESASNQYQLFKQHRIELRIR